MFGFLRSVLFWILIIFLGGAYLFFQGNSFGSEDAQIPQEAPIQKDIPSVNALLVQVDEVTGNRRVLECKETGCTPKQPPKSVEGVALSDGTAWYRYAEYAGKNTKSVTVLEKVDNAGKVQTITEENPLVKPRAMILSTDGTKIAYFLDNTHNKADLTELWIYDSKEGGARVLAEKLYRKDVASRVRWNASSRALWFLQDTGAKKLIVTPLGGGTGMPGFTGIDWNEHAKVADSGVMDINDNASLAAFAENTTPGFSRLFVVRGSEMGSSKSIKGTVVFVRWMENDSLLYATQDGKNLTFWMANATKEWPITRMDAMFESAHSGGDSSLAAFVASPRQGERHLYVLQIESGLIKDETVIPYFPGKTYVVQTNQLSEYSSHAVAGMTSMVSDGELAAFIEQHIGAITEETQVKPSRMLVTDIPNTAFIDYEDSNGMQQRIMVAVVDAVNPEWKVIARYKTINGIWNRADGSSTKEPKVVRLYEWEDALSQWILKQSF